MSKFLFTEDAWSDDLYWQTQDKKMLKRINQLLQDIERNGYSGLGKPEPLRGIYRVSGVVASTTSTALFTAFRRTG